MSILAVLRLASGVDRARIAPVLDDEVRTLWELYTQGAVTQVYLTDSPATVVLLLDGRDLTEARDALERLPLVGAGLMTVELRALLTFRNWQRLFGPTDTR